MAVRDKSQQVAFLYSNLYSIYKKAKDSKPAFEDKPGVLNATDLEKFNVNVKAFQPRVLNPSDNAESLYTSLKSNANPFEDLKGNLNKLQDLHSKLRFMLSELEELVKDKK